MKKTSLILALLFCSFLAISQSNKLTDLSFILGRWEMPTKTGKITEEWTKRSGELSGRSYRHSASGDSVLTETVVIKNIKGKLNYCVTGYEEGNRGTTDFQLISFNKTQYIFENKQHDFPQRIVYENKGKHQLLAWIEGPIQGKTTKYEFNFRRKK